MAQNIVLLEQSRSLREKHAKVLRGTGFEIKVADISTSSVFSINADTFAVVIDVDPEDIRWIAFDLLRKIRSRREDIRLIVCSIRPRIMITSAYQSYAKGDTLLRDRTEFISRIHFKTEVLNLLTKKP